MVANIIAYYLNGNTLIEHNVVTDSVNEYSIELKDNYYQFTTNHPKFQIPMTTNSLANVYLWHHHILYRSDILLMRRIVHYLIAVNDALSNIDYSKFIGIQYLYENGDFIAHSSTELIVPTESEIWTMEIHIYRSKVLLRTEGEYKVTVCLSFVVTEVDPIDTRIEYSPMGFPVCLYIETDSSTQLLVPAKYKFPRWRLSTSPAFYQYGSICLTTRSNDESRVDIDGTTYHQLYKPDSPTIMRMGNEDYKDIHLKQKSYYTEFYTTIYDSALRDMVFYLTPDADLIVDFVCEVIDKLFELGILYRNYNEAPGTEQRLTSTYYTPIVRSRLSVSGN